MLADATGFVISDGYLTYHYDVVPRCFFFAERGVSANVSAYKTISSGTWRPRGGMLTRTIEGRSFCFYCNETGTRRQLSRRTMECDVRRLGDK